MADSDAQIEAKQTPLVLLTGATGYLGRRVVPRLEQPQYRLRCLARNPEKIRSQAAQSTEIVKGDVLDRPSLDALLTGVDVAYYLVHLMSSADFEDQDRRAAKNFAGAAKTANVRRIIFYLGGLGEESDPKLSPHLRSRHEVGRVLRESGVETIQFRASVVIDAGSLSFELIRSLADRLPVMVCPRWLATATPPIAVDDVLAYLLAAIDRHSGPSRVFEKTGLTYSSLSRVLELETSAAAAVERIAVSDNLDAIAPSDERLAGISFDVFRQQAGEHLDVLNSRRIHAAVEALKVSM